MKTNKAHTRCMKVVVWVDEWQMKCCGDPFTVGSTVHWSAVPANMEDYASVLGAAGAPNIDFHEEHHSDVDGAQTVNGRVLSIRAVFHRFTPIPDSNPRHLFPVEGSAQFTPVTRATGWEDAVSGLDFAGYLVEVESADLDH